MTGLTPSMAKKTEDAKDAEKTYSNRRDKKNKHSSGQKLPTRTKKKKGRNKEKLLCNTGG